MRERLPVIHRPLNWLIGRFTRYLDDLGKQYNFELQQLTKELQVQKEYLLPQDSDRLAAWYAEQLVAPSLQEDMAYLFKSLAGVNGIAGVVTVVWQEEGYVPFLSFAIGADLSDPGIRQHIGNAHLPLWRKLHERGPNRVAGTDCVYLDISRGSFNELVADLPEAYQRSRHKFGIPSPVERASLVTVARVSH